MTRDVHAIGDLLSPDALASLRLALQAQPHKEFVEGVRHTHVDLADVFDDTVLRKKMAEFWRIKPRVLSFLQPTPAYSCIVEEPIPIGVGFTDGALIGCTLFVHPKWSPSMGGEILFLDESKTVRHRIYPRPGALVFHRLQSPLTRKSRRPVRMTSAYHTLSWTYTSGK